MHEKMTLEIVENEDNKVFIFKINGFLNYYTSSIYSGDFNSNDLLELIEKNKGIYGSQNSFYFSSNETCEYSIDLSIMYPPNADEIKITLNREKCIEALKMLYEEIIKVEQTS